MLFFDSTDHAAKGIDGGDSKGSVGLIGLTWVGEKLDGIGLENSSSFAGVVGNGSDIGFWVDRDNWRWVLQDDGNFTVKGLSKMVDEKILRMENGRQETV
ncbi:hypothetical protein Tco_1246383 [Tanacetum coccineum]